MTPTDNTQIKLDDWCPTCDTQVRHGKCDACLDAFYANLDKFEKESKP